jgi:hypothetical protein
VSSDVNLQHPPINVPDLFDPCAVTRLTNPSPIPKAVNSDSQLTIHLDIFLQRFILEDYAQSLRPFFHLKTYCDV